MDLDNQMDLDNEIPGQSGPNFRTVDAEQRVNFDSGLFLDPKQIVENSPAWTLASDAGLLNYLEKSSNELLDNASLIQKQLDDVLLEAKRTSNRFGNVNNKFLGLTNTQFIENRVYDEDIRRKISVPDQNEKVKSKAEKETEMLACVRNTVEMGTAILRSHFHKIEIRPSDFDEDDDPSFKPPPIYEPLDPYVNRPLPYVIGTSDFMKWDHVGLKEDEPEETKHAADEADDTIIVSMTREQNTVADEQPTAPSRPIDVRGAIVAQRETEKAFGGDSGESDDSLFGKPSPPEDSSFLAAPDPVQAPPPLVRTEPSAHDLLNSELSKKLGPSERIPQQEPKAAPRKQPPNTAAQAEQSDDEDLFRVPPPLGPSRSQSVRSQAVGNTDLFETRTGGLFDDDEDDIFGGPTIPSSPKTANRAPTLGSTTVKPEERPKPSRVLPIIQNKNERESAQVREKPKTTPSFGGGLFGEEESDEDDIFSNATSRGKKIATGKSVKADRSSESLFRAESANSSEEVVKLPPPKKQSLFDSDEEDEVSSVSTVEGNEKPPVFGGVGMFGTAGKSIAEEILKKKHSNDTPSQSEENKLISPEPVGQKDEQKVEPKKTLEQRSNATDNLGLFGDESEEEDLFAVIASKKTPAQSKKSVSKNLESTDQQPDKKQTQRALSPGIFSDDMREENEIFGSSTVTKPKGAMKEVKKSGLFESDDEDSGFLVESLSKSPASVKGDRRPQTESESSGNTKPPDAQENSAANQVPRVLADKIIEARDNSSEIQGDTDNLTESVIAPTVTDSASLEETRDTAPSAHDAKIEVVNDREMPPRDEGDLSKNAGARSALESVLVAGLKKNLDKKTDSSNISAENGKEQTEHQDSGDSEESVDPFSTSHRPLQSLSKSRAKIPVPRRLPTRGVTREDPTKGQASSSALEAAVQSTRAFVHVTESPPESPPPMPVEVQSRSEDAASPVMGKIRVFDPLTADFDDESPPFTHNNGEVPTEGFLEQKHESGEGNTRGLVDPLPDLLGKIKTLDNDPKEPDGITSVSHKLEQNRQAKPPLLLDSDEEDIFATSTATKTVKTQAKREPDILGVRQQNRQAAATKKLPDPLSLSDEENIFSERKPAAGQAQRGAGKLIDEDSEDIFGAESTGFKHPPKSNTGNTEQKKRNLKISNKDSKSLFADDEDSDLDIFK